MLSIFSCTFCHLNIYFSGICIFRSPAYFLIRLFGGFLVLRCMSCLYILDINPLSVISFANIFSHSVDYLFIIDAFLYCAKAFNVVPFVYFCLKRHPKNITTIYAYVFFWTTCNNLTVKHHRYG